MSITRGAEIARWRAAQGLSVPDAAPILGLSRRTIEGLEALDGELTPADTRRVQAAIAFHLARRAI